MHKTLIPILTSMACLFLAGCSTKQQTATEKTAQPKEEYVRRSTTGSWISQKVPKSQVQTSDQESKDAQQAMGELQRRGNQTPRETRN